MIVKSIEKYLKLLPEREKDILRLRFGLGEEAPLSLQKTGEKYKITRERVRQIQNEILRKIKEGILSDENLNKVVDFAEKLIKKNNGFFDEDLENEIILNFDSGAKKYYVRFLLMLAPEIKFEKKDDFHHNFYSLKEKSQGFKKFFHFVSDEFYDQKLEYEKFKLKIFSIFKKHLKENIKEESLNKILKISKKIWLNPFNEGGHEENLYIAPKNVREKILAILSYYKKPLHFKELHQIVLKLKENTNELIHPTWKKTFKIETIHNELIRRDSFILAGRGFYALKDWGYSDKTVRDLILEYLSKNKKPVKKDEVIKYVLSKKIVKPKVVQIIIYQLKDKIKLLGDGMISLK